MLTAPGASLPQPGLWVWVLVGALAPLFYAFEGAYVAASRAPGAGPFQLLWAGSVVALFVLIGLNLAFGGTAFAARRLRYGRGGDRRRRALSMAAYAGYIALLQRWGAVFGAQVAYTVTGAASSGPCSSWASAIRRWSGRRLPRFSPGSSSCSRGPARPCLGPRLDARL
jgi:hypothetical protein